MLTTTIDSTKESLEKHVGYNDRLDKGSAQEKYWLEEEALKKT